MTYTATDRRVYNDALCTDMQKESDHIEHLETRMKKADPTASYTYFPAEGKYIVFINSNIMENPALIGPPRILTGTMHPSKQLALIEAINVLEKD